MSSDRRIDMSIRTGSQLVTRPGWGIEQDQNQRRWDNYGRIIGGLNLQPLGAKTLNIPDYVQPEWLLNRYLMVGNIEAMSVPGIRTVGSDTEIEMASAQLLHPVSVYDLDTGERISLIV